MVWNASDFFRLLTENNRLAQSKEFVFCDISGLEGLEEALQHQQANNFVGVSDISEGYMDLNNTPKTRFVKTVFLAMKYPVDDLRARTACMDVMRELFRQFMSVLIREKVRLENDFIYIDDRISFNEIDRYFFNGAACAYFNIALSKFTDLRLRREEWLPPSVRVFTDEFGFQFS